MIKEFVEKWDKHKKDLENYFRTTPQIEYQDYIDIVKALFFEVINAGNIHGGNDFDINNIVVIDDGEYQGNQIFILHKNNYQPSVDDNDYVYTNTYYGSCSGCDTLQSISGYTDGLPTEEQVKDYMQLALNLLQKCHYMED